MTQRKKVTILIACSIVAIAAGILGWMVLIGKLNLRADVPGGYSVPKVVDLQRIEANSDGTADFSDVPTTHWAFQYVEAAYQNSIMKNGDPKSSTENCVQGSSFCIHEAVTRRLMALTIFRLKALSGYSPRTPSFCDIPLTDPDYAVIESVNRAGYMVGLGPAGSCEGKKSFGPGVDMNGPYFSSLDSGHRWDPDELTMTVLQRVLGKAPQQPPNFSMSDHASGSATSRVHLAALLAYNFSLAYNPQESTDPTKVLLDWNAEDSLYPESDQTVGFQIYRVTGSSYPTDNNLMWTIEPAPLVGEGLEDNSSGGYFFDKTVQPGASYNYYVYSFDADGNCAFDDPERDTWQHACPPPAIFPVDIPAQ